MAAKVFIDSSYEGDLMAKAGVSYVTGREPNQQYGETLNGKYPKPSTRIHIDPYVVPGDASSGLLPPAISQSPGQPGDGDDLVQSYNFRLCLTDATENRVPISKPSNYDPLQYEGLARFIAYRGNALRPGISRTGPVALAGNNVDLGIKFDLMPNRKTDSNDGSILGSDLSGGSQGWPEGGYTERAKIWQRHKDYIQGLLWFLGNDPRVPEIVRNEMLRWGLAKDEFADAIANGGGIYSVGYCFGGRMTLLLAGEKPDTVAWGQQVKDEEAGVVKKGPYIKAGAIAHATLVGKEDFEGTKSPLAFICVENDQLFDEEFREYGEKYLKENNVENEFKTYSGVPHGFGGAANPGALDLLKSIKARGIPIRTIARGEGSTATTSRSAIC